MKQHRLLNIILVMAMLIAGSSAYAVTSYTQFGRYLSVTNAPTNNDPYGLNTTVQREFPSSVRTVGQAINYTLDQTAYQLLPYSQTTAAVRQMYSQRLPAYLRSIGPMPLKDALLSLSGNVYQLVVDPVHRLITYKVRNQYQSL